MTIRLNNVSPRISQILTTNGLDPEKIVRPNSNWDASEFRGRRNVGSAFHGFSKTDNTVTKGKMNWNGLGINVQGAESGHEMLKLGGLDWEVEQLPLYAALPAKPDGECDTMLVDSHVLNVRSDNQQHLGVVGRGYSPCHNSTIVDLMSGLGKTGEVEIETVGTLHGGKRVWVLARAGGFAVTERDQTVSYLAACAGHDASMAINLFWTSVRIECLNTFRRAFNGRKNGYTIRHEGSVLNKITEAKAALGLMNETTITEAAEALALNAKVMTTAEIQAFFLDVYSATEGAIPANPKTEEETKARNKSLLVLAKWGELFDADRKSTGGKPSLWTAFNAVTEYQDHIRAVKGKDDEARRDNRVFGNFFGLACEKKQTVREMALALI